MAQNLLFPKYSQRENRVTAAIVAVFERLPFALVQRVLQEILEEPESDLVTFENQVRTEDSVPDGRIAGSFAYWIETKVEKNAVDAAQLRRHVSALNSADGYKTQRLLVVTPDNECPGALRAVGDPRVVWVPFADLVASLECIVGATYDWEAPSQHVCTDRERELIAELIRFIRSERLAEPAQEEVLLVAARLAYDEYCRHEVYFCQPNRSFRTCARLAFYRAGRIEVTVPRVLEQLESVHLDAEAISQRSELSERQRELLAKLLQRLSSEGSSRAGLELKVMFLSSPESAETGKLKAPIVNDLRNESGRRVAFVRGHRYVPWSRLEKGPSTTSALV